MARHYSLVCDACGRKQTERTVIHTCRGQVDGSEKVIVDLCSTCLSRMRKDYGIRVETPAQRKTFEVTPYEDIPRT